MTIHVPHFRNPRYAHSARCGKPKPALRLVDGRLVLEGSPVALESSTRWLRKFDQAAIEAKLPDWVDSIFERLLAILSEIDAEQGRRGAEVLLVSEIARPGDAARSAVLRSLDVARSLTSESYELPDGLEHINEGGDGVLAWAVARYVACEILLPPDT